MMEEIILMDWISMKDAVPPLSKTVIITKENTGLISVGHIYEVAMAYSAINHRDKSVSYKWKMIDPYLDYVTHWMPLPIKK